jgi:hypothetical protein
VGQIQKIDGFAIWQDRIMAVPEFFIREAVEQTIGVGTMTAELAKFATDYLLDRRKRLPELIQAHRTLFPKVEQGLWNLPKGEG